MQHFTRRDFLQVGAALSGMPILAAEADTNVGDEPVYSSATVPAPSGARQCWLLSPLTSGAAPFAFGFAFRQGDIPSGQGVMVSLSTAQVTVMNRWPDGSAKFAVVAGRTPLAADTPLAVSLSAGTAQSGTALTLAALKATGITASVDTDSFGSAVWGPTSWDQAFMQWISGPEMSSWLFRKPLSRDTHLVAWLEVRVWAGGAVEVLPWIENGFLRVPGPTSKAATYTFTLGGTTRFSQFIDLPHHCRTPLVSGTRLSHWLGMDPAITVRHDVQYMMATELVPTYRAELATTAASKLVTTFTPLQKGNINYSGDAMSSTGYANAIGLLPEHDVYYLACNSAAAVYGSVVRNGYSAGRYALHYRDETTQRPLRFSQYPTLAIPRYDASGFKDAGGSTTNSYVPRATGTVPREWDVAHAFSAGFMAYLVTARWYFMEQVQFAATAEYLGKGDNAALRNGSKNLVQTAAGAWQTRACAWQWRTLIQALTVTPDRDVLLRNEFIASAEANIDHFHSRYVARSSHPLHLIFPGAVYSNPRSIPMWQDDFVTATFGYAVSLGLPLSSAGARKLLDFFQWKAEAVVGRLGPATGWWYVNAALYRLIDSPVDNPDYVTGAGPWYDTWASAYAATYTALPTGISSTEGVLAAGPDSFTSSATGMWGNLQPAIAYAVRHAAPGALEAYARMISAQNWPVLQNQFNSAPVWSVRPALNG